ncbi:MAG: 23S rRNA (uracil(1939)-C(5))-methyltransferase RlmD [Ignavibacteria bacterium]|nr:23S rRNA (uracil(1939)-C(5))-methyltransferase RlmD [Ignavibacteria bacterium]
MKVREELILRTEKAVNQGYCLSHFEGKVVLVENCLPNELVRAKIKKVKKDYVEARAIEILEPSPKRIEPICKYFGLCGGCKFQNLKYEEQLNIKKALVEEAFQRTSKIFGLKINDVIPSDEEYFYRNKIEFSFAKRWLFNDEKYTEKEKEFALGFHIPKQYDKVIHIDECFLQSHFSNRIRNFVADFLFKKGATIHSLKNRDGLLKGLLVRESKNVNEKLVGLITTKFDENIIYELTNLLLENFPELTTFVNILSSPNISSTLPEEIRTIYGRGYIYEKLFDYKFEIYPNTFFQTNTKQAEKLFGYVINYLKNELLSKGQKRFHTLIDLYSGVGVIGILLSHLFESVIGFEEIRESIEAAKRNAVLNNINNISFIQRDLNKGFVFSQEIEKKDLILIADPPRTGMTEKTIQSILKIKPSIFIYISCNPITQARDLASFIPYYEIKFLQPVDMFPQTYHIENIAILKILSHKT